MIADAISRRVQRHVKRTVHGRIDLLALFEQEIRAGHISELHSCNDHDLALEAAARMDENGFDVLGIRAESDGRSDLYGYIRREDLHKGICKDYARPFRSSELIANGTPLLDTLAVLRDQERVFVIERTVYGIITRADLQKYPVRLLLFGLVSMLETAMLHKIRRGYEDSEWCEHLSSGRLDLAAALLDQRRQRNEEIDLADCLQLCDKRNILVRNKEQRERLGFSSKKAAVETFKSIEKLRDRLAHSQDLVAGSDWPNTLLLVDQMEDLIARLEIWAD